MRDMKDIPPGTVKCAQGLGNLKAADVADLPPNPDKIRDAAHALDDAFRWSSAPEGDVFWSTITERLFELADFAETAARRLKVPEPVMIADETCDIHRVVGVSVIDGVVRWSSDGEVRDFCPTQARKAAAALVKMADALDGQS